MHGHWGDMGVCGPALDENYAMLNMLARFQAGI